MRPASVRIWFLSWVVMVERAELTTPTGRLLLAGGPVMAMEGITLLLTVVVVVVAAVLLAVEGLKGRTMPVVVVMVVVTVVVVVVAVVVAAELPAPVMLLGGGLEDELPAPELTFWGRLGVVVEAGLNTGCSIDQVVKERSPDGRGSGRGKGVRGRFARAWAKFSFISGIKCTRSLSHLL